MLIVEPAAAPAAVARTNVDSEKEPGAAPETYDVVLAAASAVKMFSVGACTREMKYCVSTGVCLRNRRTEDICIFKPAKKK